MPTESRHSDFAELFGGDDIVTDEVERELVTAEVGAGADEARD